jgi:alkanesulfonate monooxygenase SsuD/methylene tetrahydromethanopterin reductase-like flavin-dependent oxidoreductase (luciferase family)
MEFGSFMEFHVRQGKSQLEAFRESFAHVDQAEEQGLDAVWLAESHFNPERAVLSAPLIVAAAIAGRTKRVGSARRCRCCR